MKIENMELPDFMSYANRFSASDFIDKISRIAKRAGAKLVYAALILFYTLQSDKISTAMSSVRPAMGMASGMTSIGLII